MRGTLKGVMIAGAVAAMFAAGCATGVLTPLTPLLGDDHPSIRERAPTITGSGTMSVTKAITHRSTRKWLKSSIASCFRIRRN